jgi:hypothetical protein
MKQKLFLIAFLGLTFIACHLGTPPRPKNEVKQFEVETGYPVHGKFLQFYPLYGGEESLGSPLSEEISVGGWQVQYFEKGRLEYHPENEPAYQVTVGWLGDLLQRRRPPIPPEMIPPATMPSRRYFAETGHTLSGDFLDYFDHHGGTVRFGLPISEPFLLDGKLTQDFQSARFFWAPQAAEPVMLENIGQVHLEMLRRGE